jgi:hypothetical protein
MTADLRGLIDRPLGARRLGAFAAVACVLLLVAGGLALTAGHRYTPMAETSDGRPATNGRTSQTVGGAVVVATLDADPFAAGSPGGERAVVVRQARRFLAGYLPYLYGQGPVRVIRAGTVTLRRRLETAPLRVSPAARKRRPRVVRVTAESLDRRRWHVVATIADGGVTRYPIELLLTTGARGVRVAEVSSE